MAQRKNPAAVALAKRKLISMSAEERKQAARAGGLVGGRARAKALTKAERVAIAKKAVAARWAKAKKAQQIRGGSKEEP
jgi:hypothetical protein